MYIFSLVEMYGWIRWKWRSDRTVQVSDEWSGLSKRVNFSQHFSGGIFLKNHWNLPRKIFLKTFWKTNNLNFSNSLCYNILKSWKSWNSGRLPRTRHILKTTQLILHCELQTFLNTLAIIKFETLTH